MTHLVQLLLPLADNNGRGFSQATFAAVRHELTQQFGGVTAFMRSPATGLWKKERLAQTFGQDALVVRAIGMETL